MSAEAATAKVADSVLKDLEKRLSAKSLKDFPSRAKALAEIAKTRKILGSVEKELVAMIKAEAKA